MKADRLKRYTVIESLRRIFATSKLKFSDPNCWEDKNDTELLELYRHFRKARKVFALCFASEGETIHLWKAYAGPTGCCINFNTTYILKMLRQNKITHDHVVYKEIKNVANSPIAPERFPFIKRWPYRIEREYRAIWVSYENVSDFEISVDLAKCVDSIVFAPGVDERGIKELASIWNKSTGTDLRQHKTTVYRNKQWINIFRSALKPS